MRRPVLFVSMLFAGTCQVPSQAPAASQTTLKFHLVRPGLAVPEYTLVFNEPALDGAAGLYTAGIAPAPTRYGTATGPAEAVAEPLRGGEKVAAELIRLARGVQELQNCASRRKGVADTGAKMLTLNEGTRESTVCRYNYSENTSVQELTRRLQAIAFTLDAGRKMERDQRFDRLALDADMTGLTEAVKQGMAAGLVWIRPELERLAGDASLLERVRTQAGRLLEIGSAEEQTGAMPAVRFTR